MPQHEAAESADDARVVFAPHMEATQRKNPTEVSVPEASISVVRIPFSVTGPMMQLMR